MSDFDYTGSRAVVIVRASGVGAALLELLRVGCGTDLTVLDLKAPSDPDQAVLTTD